MRIAALPALAFLAVAASDSAAFGWGDKGHRVHGELAWRLLDDATRARVAALIPNETLSSIANWADEIRDERPETRPWHYVNIDPADVRYVAARDCEEDACVVARLERFTASLSDPATPTDERREALKWVVHLVGDVHQPLHVALLEDRGGNDIAVEFGGKETNLHRLWDVDLLERFGASAESHAAELAADLNDEDRETWRRGGPADWADESFALAKEWAYRDERGARIESGAILGREYWLTRSVIADRQLKRAAVRLAWVLERAFARG